MNNYLRLEKLLLNISQSEPFLPRLNQELTLVKQQNSAKSFLKAFDFVTDLQQKNVLIGPANGYTNSSLINFLLGITTINPLDYNLICEPYFNSNYFSFNINASDIEKVSKEDIKNDSLTFNELPILRKYQLKSHRPDYRFYPDNVNDTYIFKNGNFKFDSVENKGKVMSIKSEQELISHLAMNHLGMNDFHYSKLFNGNQLLFEEVEETNGYILFREQWILLISKYCKIDISIACKIGSEVGKRKMTRAEFRKYFKDDKTTDYLYDIVYFLPTKSHTIAEAKILILESNLQ